MQEPLALAVAQPPCAAGDVGENARRHAAAVRSAAARVVVFPELSLTGYELATAPVVDPADPLLSPLVEACADTSSVALVGAPVHAAGHDYIATLAVTGSGAVVAYRKVWLGSDETRRFTPGDAPAAYEVDGWRLGLAVCKDTSVPAHATATAALGVDGYVASLVMHPDEADEQHARGGRIARDLGVPVAFAGFAGPTGSGYPATCGRSSIWSARGHVLAHAQDGPGEIARAVLR